MQIKLLTLDSSGYNHMMQLEKIIEEYHEVLKAYYQNDAFECAKELIDLMQASKTMLEMIEDIYDIDTRTVNEQHIAKLKQRAADGRIKLIKESEV